MKAEHATTSRQEQQIIQRNAAQQRSAGNAQKAQPLDLFAQMLQDNIATETDKDTAALAEPLADAKTPDKKRNTDGDSPDTTLAATIAALFAPHESVDNATEGTTAASTSGDSLKSVLATDGKELTDQTRSEALTAEENAQAAISEQERPTDTRARTRNAQGTKAAEGMLRAAQATGHSAHDIQALAHKRGVESAPGAQGAAQRPTDGAAPQVDRSSASPLHAMAANVASTEGIRPEASALTAAAEPTLVREASSHGASSDSGSDAGGTGVAATTDNGTSPTDSTQPQDAPSFADSLGQAMGDALESLGAQVSMWASQNTKRAAMRLDAGLSQALDVDVTLKDGQAHIHFRTDDAQAREAIRTQAQTVLADLLARNGMDLGSVSVGAQGGNTQDRQARTQDGRGDARGLHRALDRVSASDTSERGILLRPRSQGALDIYA